MNGTASKNFGPYVVAGIVSVFLIVIAYMMFFVPRMNESKALVSQAATAHANNAALTARADKLEAIATNLDPLKKQVGDFSQSFPSVARQQEMIDAINEAASSTGVTLTTLSPNVPKAKEGEGSAVSAGAAPSSAAPVEPSSQGGMNLPGAAPVNKAPESVAASPTAKLGSVSLKIDASGSLDSVQAFIVRIEGLKRPLLAQEMQIEKQANGYHVTVSGETFLAAPLTEPTGAAASSEVGDFPKNTSK